MRRSDIQVPNHFIRQYTRNLEHSQPLLFFAVLLLSSKMESTEMSTNRTARYKSWYGLLYLVPIEEWN